MGITEEELTSGGSGGIGSLQEAYNNGKKIETLTGAIELQEKTGDDDARIVAYKNNSGDIVASVRGTGLMSSLFGLFNTLGSNIFSAVTATVDQLLKATSVIIGVGDGDPNVSLTVYPATVLQDYYLIHSPSIPAVDGNYIPTGADHNGYPVYEQDGGTYKLFACSASIGGAAISWAISLDLDDIYNFSVQFQQSTVDLSNPSNDFYLNPLNTGQLATVSLIQNIDTAASFRGNIDIQGDALVKNIKSLDGISTLNFEKTGDDRAAHLENAKLEIGSVGNGWESIFGEGNSYPAPICYHAKESNTSGNTITGAIDITEIVQSESGSSIGLFGGIAIGDYILVGSDYPFPGAKSKNSVLHKIDGTDFVVESLIGVGNWNSTKIMNTNASFPLEQEAHHIGIHDKEQWFFGFDPLTPSLWIPQTLNINGVDETKYWGRFRLINNIANDLIIEQIKLRTNSTELNEDGTGVHYGKGRLPVTLQAGLQIATPNALNDPANESVKYGADFTAKYIDNEFKNGVVDGFGIIQNINYGLDTSIPIVLTVSYYVKGTVTGSVEFTADVFQVGDGFVYDGTATPDKHTYVDTITTSSNLIRRTAVFTIDASYVSPTEALTISLYRDSLSANDTLSASIIITHVTINGYKWRF